MYAGAFVSVVLGKTCRRTATDLSATLLVYLVHRIAHLSDGSLMFICTRIQHVIHTTQKRIESSSDTRKKLTSASFPSNKWGFPTPLRSLTSSASLGVEVIVSDFGFFGWCCRILNSAGTTCKKGTQCLPLSVFDVLDTLAFTSLSEGGIFKHSSTRIPAR